MARPIPPLDLMWLIMETQASPTHVGALLLFEKPKGRPRVVREIVETYRSYEPTPPFNYLPEVVGTRMPRFLEAKSYDPRYHNQHLALPEGATYDDLLRLVTDLHEPMLDRDRPLFRNWIIDGVPDNLFAIYAKVHHAIIDGVSGTKRLYSSLGTGARQAIQPPAFAAELPVRKPRPPKALVDRLAELGFSATRQTLAFRDVSFGALKKRLALLLGADPVGSAPFTAQRGPMNAPLQMARSVATLSLPLDEMHAVGKHFGATLNDLAVTIVDAGVHRYLRQADRAFPHRLVAFCPVSLRGEGDTDAGTKASAMFVHLGEHEATVVERIKQVVAAMGTAKQELRSMSKDAAMTYAVALLGVAELTTATHIDRVTPPLANMVISNVPGARQQMYLNGAPLIGTFPVSAIAMSVGLNATLTSYNDRMDFGFVGNGATMYDLPELARHVQEAYQELRSAASKKRPAKRSTTQPRKSRSAPARCR
ncbi:MAG: wax ester/triacylglycerol synthase family O-acyltransferase [Steroidobacteraceae bacterium]|jgi:WS/DGAT/MGAT family acyltransferase|nr:wax ester/triacylglycerol synthase family O-acyltransferase [Steroidobacteraceae bacterium]MBP9129792.1 wax ester/triacylglycerol synthase family O-acyltransferase [Steroidobacteraceae bacterium]